jgi:Ca2+-transporting ATPase
VFAVYYWAFVTGHSEADVRALTFATLVVGNLGLILVNRSWTKTVFGGLRGDRNPALVWVLSGAIGFLVVLLTVPFMRELFRFAPIHGADILLVIVAGVAGVLWFEAYKMVRAARRKGLAAAEGQDGS